jgi:biotin carboxylase
MKNKDKKPNVILMLIDDETEELCKLNGLTLWGVTAELFNYLGNKVKIIDLLSKAGIPFIHNICSTIKSYQHLLELTSSFNTNKICIQAQDGCGGWGTFFISNEADYSR